MNRNEALALLDEDFPALSRDQKVIDALSAIIMAKGEFAGCTLMQRFCAFILIERMNECGSTYAHEIMERLVNLN